MLHAGTFRLFKHRLGRYEKMPDCTGGRTGDNEAHEHVELRRPRPSPEKRARTPRLSDNRCLGREAQPLCHLGSRGKRAIPQATHPESIGSVQRFKRRLKKIAWRLPMRPLVRFIYAYFLRLGFLDGKPGLVFCGLLAFYDFLASANRYEQNA